MNKNELAFNSLRGNGIEFGALHNPIEYNNDIASVLYADRLTKTQAIKAFPELGEHASSIVETDLILDLDRDDLCVIKEKNIDFVVANHVIEHVVNPIRFLRQVSDNLKSNGLFFLTVPDKEFTHDKNRDLTRFRHLFIEYHLNIKELSNKHIKDYLKNKLPVKNIPIQTVEYFKSNNLPLSYYEGNKIPLNPVMRKRLYEYHRSRSIHVHVWNRESFGYFLNKSIEMFNLNFVVEEYLQQDVSVGEMIYLLRKVNK